MLILCDGSNLLHRILYTPQIKLTNSIGIKTGCFHGFIKSLAKLIRLNKGNGLIVVAWDEGQITFRQNIYSEYKGWKKNLTRDGGITDAIADPELNEIYIFSRSMLHCTLLPLLGVPSIMVPHLEADDIIAYTTFITKMFSMIVSTDDDLMQLINHKTVVFKPNQEKTYDLDTFISKYGLRHDRYIEHFLLMKSIQGDASDGIPGISGIGEVNASRIATILINDQTLNPNNKKDKLVLDHWDEIERNKKLVTSRYWFDNDPHGKERIRSAMHSVLVNFNGNSRLLASKFRELEMMSVANDVPDITHTVNGSVRQELITELESCQQRSSLLTHS